MRVYIVNLSDGGEYDDLDWVALKERWDGYRAYLDSIRAQLPPAAAAFALADWHYSAGDHRCPHDAWVDAVEMQMVPSLSTFYRTKRPPATPRHQLEIWVRLLGAYHDGLLLLHYTGVHSYSLTTGGDWLIDEIRLADEGRLIHEISFGAGRHWLIDCADLSAEWQPF